MQVTCFCSCIGCLIQARQLTLWYWLKCGWTLSHWQCSSLYLVVQRRQRDIGEKVLGYLGHARDVVEDFIITQCFWSVLTDQRWLLTVTVLWLSSSTFKLKLKWMNCLCICHKFEVWAYCSSFVYAGLLNMPGLGAEASASLQHKTSCPSRFSRWDYWWFSQVIFTPCV